MFALFTAIPLVGHVNPLLHQAEALRARGWRVAFAGVSDIRAHAAAEAPDVPFVDLGSMGSIAADLRTAQAAASIDRNYARGTYRIVDALWPLWLPMFDGLSRAIAVDRPDVVVVDLFSSAGMAAADATHVPFVVNNPDLLNALSVKLLPPADHLPFLFSGRSQHAVRWHHRTMAPIRRRLEASAATLLVGRRLNALRSERSLPPVDVHEMLRDRTVLVNGAFGLEYPRPLPPTVAMVGPMLPATTPPLPDDVQAWLDGDAGLDPKSGRGVAYINFGTLAQLSVWQLTPIFDALAGASHRSLWILRAAQAQALPTPPAHVRILDWGPTPLAVLAHPNVRAFVSHCGINSVHESLWAGTPIVGLPLFADQRDMAARVADAGAGLWLDKHRFTADSLRDAIDRVMTDASFRNAIPPLQEAMREAGGTARAADLIANAVVR